LMPHHRPQQRRRCAGAPEHRSGIIERRREGRTPTTGVLLAIVPRGPLVTGVARGRPITTAGDPPRRVALVLVVRSRTAQARRRRQQHLKC
jgi:hypothetical protein